MSGTDDSSRRSIAGDIEKFAGDVERFLAGKMTSAMFKAKRVPMGVYEQRQSGSFMQRVRAPGGRLTAKQAKVLASVAEKYSGEPLHITTRQDIQLHALEISSLTDAMRLLGEVELSSRGGGGNTVRNITACTYAGLCRSEVFDVNPYIDAITDYMVSIEGSYNLPRKYKISFSGCGCDCANGKINDLGFIASVKDGVPGFKVVAGGGMGAGPRIGSLLEARIPANECLASAEALRRVFDRHGDRKNRQKARLRFVFERLGDDAVRAEYAEEKKAVLAEGLIVDSSDTGRQPDSAVRPELESVEGAWIVRESTDGSVAVRLFFEGGLLTASALAQIAAVTEKYSQTDRMRLTVDQGLLIESVPEDRLGELVSELKAVSPQFLEKGWRTSIVACAGAATCRLGLCLSRGLMKGCEDEFKSRGISSEGLEEELIRINGCPNACGKHLIGGIGLSGAARRHDGKLYPAYSVLLGGRAGADPVFGKFAEIVPAKAIPGMLAEIIALFRENAADEETFAEFVVGSGSESVLAVVGKYAALPKNAYELDYARDWGSDEDFSLAGRGAGECGAGVFEVVSEDIATAEAKMKESLESDDPLALGEAFLSSVRALLIVRGVDEVEPDAIVREFEKNYVDSGLVDERFRGVLVKGRAYLSGVTNALDGQSKEVTGLLGRVRELYDSLDASLHFNVAAVAGKDEPQSAEGAAQHQIDLKGVACPINFVKAKLKLETIPVGDVLAITLDDGEPVKNVPASFRQEGQEVISMDDIGGGHWTVVIKRVK